MAQHIDPEPHNADITTNGLRFSAVSTQAVILFAQMFGLPKPDKHLHLDDATVTLAGDLADDFHVFCQHKGLTILED